MHSPDIARHAYASPAAPVRTARATEYDLFARVTGRLKAGATNPDAAFPELVRALHDNRRLWLALAADAAEPGNQLPTELRARIVYLAEFTQVHSRKILSGEATPDALVEINTAIMRGLRQTGPVA